MNKEEIEKKMHEAAEEIKPLVTTLVEALCEAHQKGYLAGVELGVNIGHPHWIPVEERLPNEGQVVLVYTKRGTVSTACYTAKLFNAYNVTHWMPIVPPRKEE